MRAAAHRVAIVLGLAPVTAVLSLLFIGPLLVALAQSLGHAPIYGVEEFPTLRYYARVFGSSRFRIALLYTLYYAVVPTIVSTVAGVALALALRHPIRGSRVLIAVLRLPVVVPYLVGAAVVVALFANGGLIARVLFALGAIGSTGDFPRVLFSAGGWGVMLVYLFKQIPFTFIVVSAALAGDGAQYEEVARSLGATPVRALWHVVLPRVVPAIVTASLLVFAFNFQTYEIPYLLGATFPNTLPVEAMRRFNAADLSRRPEAMAYLMVITAISGVVLAAYLQVYRRWERGRRRS